MDSHKTKNVGIVVDNYKIPKYMDTLKEKGFTPGPVKPLTPTTTSITLTVTEEQVKEIGNLCTVLEHQFKSN